MCNCKKNIKVDESYVSFKDIDCFENACLVIDNLLRILKEPKNTNAYWEKFIEKIPEAYYARNSEQDPSEALLYLVCSCTSNIMELFEEIDDDDAIDAMSKCEQECC
ncbi:N(2)-fixation sustaining protein CowN [Deferribacteres bacterium DY0037]